MFSRHGVEAVVRYSFTAQRSLVISEAKIGRARGVPNIDVSRDYGRGSTGDRPVMRKALRHIDVRRIGILNKKPGNWQLKLYLGF